MSTKNELPMSTRTMPTVSVVPAARLRAALLRTNPRWAIAASTLRRVVSATRSGRFSTFETVPTATPALRATSSMLGVARWRTGRRSRALWLMPVKVLHFEALQDEA
jgi:hypothetical protein